MLTVTVHCARTRSTITVSNGSVSSWSCVGRRARTKKFFSSQPGKDHFLRSCLLNDTADCVREAYECGVACGVPVFVVHSFEMIDVDNQGHDVAVPISGHDALEQCAHLCDQSAAIEQAGQRVRAGRYFKPVIETFEGAVRCYQRSPQRDNEGYR